MDSLSLKTRLLRFLQKNHPMIFAKGQLCDMARERTGATGEHTGRRLRELENENLVKVTYVKGHAHYQATEPMKYYSIMVNGEVVKKVAVYN